MQKTSAKILVITLILALVAGVWIFKNHFDSGDVATSSSHSNATDSETLPQDDRTDFESTVVDMDEFLSAGVPLMINFSGEG